MNFHEYFWRKNIFRSLLWGFNQTWFKPNNTDLLEKWLLWRMITRSEHFRGEVSKNNQRIYEWDDHTLSVLLVKSWPYVSYFPRQSSFFSISRQFLEMIPIFQKSGISCFLDEFSLNLGLNMLTLVRFQISELTMLEICNVMITYCGVMIPFATRPCLQPISLLHRKYIKYFSPSGMLSRVMQLWFGELETQIQTINHHSNRWWLGFQEIKFWIIAQCFVKYSIPNFWRIG